MIDPTAHVAELCRLYLLVTLAAAVAGKASDIASFEAAIAELFGLRRSAARHAAYAIIGVEAVVASLLLAGGRWAVAGTGAALLLFLAFTAVISGALVRQKAVRCNCFGGGGHRLSIYDLLRNGLLIAAAAFSFLYGGPTSLSASFVTMLLLGLALILFLISSSLRDILTVAGRAPT